MLTVTKIDSSDDQLKRFWELDAIGIVNHQEHQRTVEEEDAVNQFNSSCRFDADRYEVGLPWKKDHSPLVDNNGQAYQLLVSTERILAIDSEKARLYCEAVSQYIEDGHARSIAIDEEDHKADKIRYLPHHGVFEKIELRRSAELCSIVAPKRMMGSLSTPVSLKVQSFSQISDMFLSGSDAIGSVSWWTSRKCFFRSSSKVKIRTATDSCGEICTLIDHRKFIA